MTGWRAKIENLWPGKPLQKYERPLQQPKHRKWNQWLAIRSVRPIQRRLRSTYFSDIRRWNSGAKNAFGQGLVVTKVYAVQMCCYIINITNYILRRRIEKKTFNKCYKKFQVGFCQPQEKSPMPSMPANRAKPFLTKSNLKIKFENIMLFINTSKIDRTLL